LWYIYLNINIRIRYSCKGLKQPAKPAGPETAHGKTIKKAKYP